MFNSLQSIIMLSQNYNGPGASNFGFRGMPIELVLFLKQNSSKVDPSRKRQ